MSGKLSSKSPWPLGVIVSVVSVKTLFLTVACALLT